MRATIRVDEYALSGTSHRSGGLNQWIACRPLAGML